ncbi:MAG: hypothetical protein A3H27_13920 [Acidobacteria bacterium RIFCSPLOWO2_02_FULL_59_13]|nr:MAG: hypothetical protein A3J28_03855 [Acidobacteria bacterium RIFCSPLOWO2_12_FULL_60_22]OFW27431.1 MAG: hypothetical protein A3H27_13920 [Acidobacteria bacterium RIFCSPLOWO2_02_FULL_59_13]
MREKKIGLKTMLHILRSHSSRKPFAGFLLATVVTSVLAFAQQTPPQTEGATSLGVAVRPDARIIIEPVDSPVSDASSGTARWFRVEVAIRLNAGATASLALDESTSSGEVKKEDVPDLKLSLKSPGDTSRRAVDGITSTSLFATQKNGTYSVLVGIDSEDAAWKGKFPAGAVRFIVRSSDGLLNVSKPVPLEGK